jgi:hypothetical protein
MIRWRPLPGENWFLYSPVGLLLVDDHNGQAPFGAIESRLEIQDGTTWRMSEREAVTGDSGVICFPGLGRSVDLTQPPQHCRVRVEVAFYRPLYRATTDGIEFDVPPYDDSNPPAVITQRPTATALLPSENYPYPTHVAVLRGVVRDLGGNPVMDVLVQEALRERTLTDERGAFSLALRWVPHGVPTVISAMDQRSGRAGLITITLPGALDQSQTITVS